MPEIRQDPVSRDWVIIATERARRPEDFARVPEEATLPPYRADCPFCEGNESMTPPEIWADRPGGGAADGPGWAVRVTPNKFAALTPSVDSEPHEMASFFREMDGFGSHEVVVETPSHNTDLCLATDAKVEGIVRAWLVRYRALEADKRFRLVTIFRNHGRAAGTSLEHPHSQILATPVVPLHVRAQLEEATRYYDNHNRCVFCEMIDREREAGSRVIAEEDGFLVFAPFAASVPFDVSILPLRHQATFGEIPEPDVPGLARVLRRTLARLHAGLGDPPYNLVVKTAPFAERDEDFYHWSLRIVPRLTTAAGFELGTGMSINTSLPEQTAAFLKAVTP